MHPSSSLPEYPPGWDPGRLAASFTLFVDLDGVLVDFDQGVRAVCGDAPENLSPRAMWPRLSRTPDFYTNLDWLEDGKLLWSRVAGLSPFILTGLPLGSWAEAQKRAWCSRELGPEAPVITCMSRDKHLAAKRLLRPGTRGILVDDRQSLREAWEGEGGIFIHHISAARSLEMLRGYIGDGM